MVRIYLSPPELAETDRAAIAAALDEGWLAPVGPQLDIFEADLSARTGRAAAVALSSGTAALHLSLVASGVQAGDRVLCSTLTFAATANAIRYVGAVPVFVDSDRATWNMDPQRLGEGLEEMSKGGRLAAVIAVDLYGQCANYSAIEPLCADRGVTLIEDAAEALGAEQAGRPAGSFGDMAVLSFNGNKIITTSGGGAFLTDDRRMADRVRFLSTQARDPAPHYQHSELGYNYRLSNILAALGRSQLADLDRRVRTRRDHNRAYREALEWIPGIEFMPDAPGPGRSTNWLTALTIDPALTGFDRESARLHLEGLDIEARPVWKPMHLQPFYADCEVIGGEVAEDLFQRGLCLPSGSSLLPSDRDRVIEAMTDLYQTNQKQRGHWSGGSPFG